MDVVRWISARPFLASLAVVVAVAAPGYFRVEQIANDANDTAHALAVEVENRTRAACDRSNENRVELRRALVDVFTNALIAAARDPVEPERIAAFRDDLTMRFDAELPLRDCDTEAAGREAAGR